MIRINLLPFRAARKKENIRRQVLIAIFMLVITIILIAYLHVTKKTEIEEKISEIEDMKNKINSLQVSVDQVNAFKAKKKALESKLDVINLLEKNREGPLNLLIMMSSVIPDKAWLTSFSQKATTLSFAGIALDNETVSLFLSNLEKEKYFKDVNLKNTQRIMQKGKSFQRFNISCKFVPTEFIKK